MRPHNKYQVLSEKESLLSKIEIAIGDHQFYLASNFKAVSQCLAQTLGD